MNDTAWTMLLVGCGLWVAATGLGLVALAPCPRPLRDALTPAAPVLGLVLVVVVLHLSSWAVPVRVGVWGLLPVVLALVVLARRRSDGGLPTRAAVAVLLAAAALGAVPAVAVVSPAVTADAALVHPAPNNDAYYYVAVTEWLVDEPGSRPPELSDGPRIGGDSVADAPARSIITQHLRLGESLVQATASAATGLDPVTLWYPATALWLGLLPGAVVALFRLLRLGTVAGLMSGLLVGVAPLAVYQVLNQNSASTLGLSIAPLALGLLAARLHARADVPLWLVAMVWAGWVGTYTEYLVLGVPAVAGMVLLRRPRHILPALIDAVRVAAVAVAMGPFIVWNAVQSLLFLGGLAADPNQPSPYLRVTWPELVNRISMASPSDGGQDVARAGGLVAVLLVVGILAALAHPPSRGLVAGLVGGAVLGFLAYSAGDSARPYNLNRLVQLAMPLVVMAAAIGWRVLVGVPGTVDDEAERRPARRRLLIAAPVAVLAWATVGLVHARVDAQIVLSNLSAGRAVDDTFAAAAGWVEELGGESGDDVMVVVPSFHSQLWLADALNEHEAVSYGVLDPSYFQTTSFWDGERDRYLLLDRSTWVGGTADVVRQNDRFLLLDTAGSDVVVAAPRNYPPYAWQGVAGGTWTSEAGELFVWLAPDAGTGVTVRAGTTVELDPLPVQVDLLERNGDPLPAADDIADASLVSEVGDLTVTLPDGTVGAVLVLQNLRPAAPSASLGDARPLSVRVEGVSGGP